MPPGHGSILLGNGLLGEAIIQKSIENLAVGGLIHQIGSYTIKGTDGQGHEKLVRISLRVLQSVASVT